MITPLLDQAGTQQNLINVYDVALVYPGQPSLRRIWDITVLPYSAQDTMAGYVLYLTDVTCREQLRQLGAEASRLRSTFDTAVDAILVIEQDGTIIDVNPAASRMFTYPHEDLVGLSLPTLMPEQRRKSTCAAWNVICTPVSRT